MIKQYRCDIPMATKKGIRRVCDRNCKHCLCALAMDGNGHEHHVGLVSGSCANITRRNRARGYYTKVEADRFENQTNDRRRVDWRFDRRRTD